MRAGWFVATVICLLARAASAQVAFDHAGSVGGGNRSETFDFTVGAGNDRYLVVAVAVTANSVPVDSISYGNQALTSIGVRMGSGCRAELWGLVAPAAGTHTVTVKLGVDPRDVIAGASSYTGVDQKSPLGRFASHTGTDNSPVSLETSVAVNSGEYTVDVVCGNGSAAPSTKAGAGQTERWGRSQGTLGAAGSTQPNDGSGRANMAWTLDGTGSIDWTIATNALEPAPPHDAGVDAAPDAAPDVAPLIDAGADVADDIADDTGPDVAPDVVADDVAVDAVAADAAPLEPDVEDAAPADDVGQSHDVHLHVGCACQTGGAGGGGGWLLLIAVISAGRGCSARRRARRSTTRRR